MENLNVEKIKVALKCHSDPKNKCEICPYNKKCCSMALSNDALALINSQEQRIKELTEENERLQKLLDDRCDRCIERERADTVRKMQSLSHEKSWHLDDGADCWVVYLDDIDQIAKELLEERE